MNEYALSTWLVGNVEAEAAIRLMADAGFTQIELSAGWAPIVAQWESAPEETCARLADAGITVPSVHCPRMGRQIDLLDDDSRIASVQEDIRYFGLMQASGIPEIVIHPVSGGADRSDEAWAATPAQSRKSLEALADAAEEAGLRLAVENLGRDGHPGSTMASILELIDGLGDHVGLCMDIGHSQQAQLDLLDELQIALSSGKLFTLHLHDVDIDGKDHRIPGEGCLDFVPFLQALRDQKYNGGRTLEVSAAPAEMVEERIGMTAAVRESWQRL